VPEVGHVPVLLNEAIDLLNPHPGGSYLDGTLGGGGHATAILERSSPDGRLLGLDLDPAALQRVAERLSPFGDRVVLAQDSFADLERVARWNGFAPCDGILLDLGLSSFQLAAPERGFAIAAPGPLDMRFNPQANIPTAGDLVNRLSADELTDLFRHFGEEPRARAIARAIVQERGRRPIATTTALAAVVERVSGPRRGRIHPATRVFQALRIAVNGELAALERALPQAIEILRIGGRLVVITFHSLEDRMVKHYFAGLASPCVCPPDFPICVCGRRPTVKLLTRHGLRPSPAEVARNPRSRSATLRAVEKIAPAPDAPAAKSGAVE
jgi:16S rRNA (cytosine1402-N4)-methyltransferase